MSVFGAFCVTVMKDVCLNERMPGKCATCAQVCPHSVYALNIETGEMKVQNYNACVGCRICSEFCPTNAIRINPAEPHHYTRYPWTPGAIGEIHYKTSKLPSLPQDHRGEFPCQPHAARSLTSSATRPCCTCARCRN